MSGPLPPLSGSLKFLGELLLGFDLNRHAHLFFKFLAEFDPRAEAPDYRSAR